MNQLTDQVVLVTGASRGFGRAVARLFAQEGARVIVNYRSDLAGAEETRSSLAGADRRHFTLGADVGNSAEVREMFRKIQVECGRLDVLVNNAGINRDGLLESITERMWDEVLTANLKGAFLCAQAAVPMLKETNGRIVNVASETSLTGRIGGCNYIAAKAGVMGLTKALAKELAPAIRVNCIALGYTHTEELADRFNLDNPENLRRMEKEVPLGRIATPEEAARVALFLSTADSSFITGQIIVAGGGRWM